MGRNLKKDEDKKTKVSVSLDKELLEYYRLLHINLSSLVNKLLIDYKTKAFFVKIIFLFLLDMSLLFFKHFKNSNF